MNPFEYTIDPNAYPKVGERRDGTRELTIEVR